MIERESLNSGEESLNNGEESLNSGGESLNNGEESLNNGQSPPVVPHEWLPQSPLDPPPVGHCDHS